MKYRREILFIAASLLVGIILALVLTEMAYRFQAKPQDRDGKQVRLMIPLGTADLLKSGGASPNIPEGMTFVVGDVLVVENQDAVDHQLGPLFIPKGTIARLTFTKPENLAYACTFTPEKYLGLEIKQPLTIATRMVGILSAGIPMGMLIALYVVFAIRPGLKKEAEMKGLS
jgi:hypothetical protein